MKDQLIEQFLKDVSDCGLYFNNAYRVKHECLMILFENGYHVLLTTKGEPQLTCFQDKKTLALIDEAHEAAFTYIRSRPGVEQKLQEEALALEEQYQAQARYYQQHGTKGEF